ncbi:hypothetical protein EON80_19035 [bacterium]|nr:MAG: hypothetical protein EON80_19035 [bacterium]
MGWKFEDDFAAAERELARGLKRATKKTAKKVLKGAQKAAPVQTGRLRDSGEINDAHRPVLGLAETSVDFTADYAEHVHDGHFNVRAGRFVAGQPFLANELTKNEDTLNDEAEKELRKLGVKRIRRT